MAFVVAGLVFLATVGMAVVIMVGRGMSDAPSQRSAQDWLIPLAGLAVTALIVASHWLNWGW